MLPSGSLPQIRFLPPHDGGGLADERLANPRSSRYLGAAAAIGLGLFAVLLMRRGPAEIDARVVWLVATGDAIRVAPASDDGRLYACSEDGWLYALDVADGRLLWQTPLGPASCPPLADRDGLYVATRHSRLVALDPRTGAPRWSQNLARPAARTLALCGDALLAVDDSGLLQAFRANDGQVRGRWALATMPCVGPLSDGFGRYFLTFPDGRVEARDPDGRLLWSTDLGRTAARHATLTDERLYLGDDDGQVAALEPRSGRLVTKVRVTAGVVAPPVVAEGWIWVVTADRTLYGVAPDPEHSWTRRLPTRPTGSLARCGGYLWLVGADRCLRAVDPQTGAPRWRLNLGADATAPLWTDGERLVFATWRGEIGAIAAAHDG